MKAAASLFFFLGLAVVLPSVAPARDAALELAVQAVAANPEVAMLHHQIESLREKERAAVIWENPVFMVEYSNIPWERPSLGEHPMSGIQLRLKQTFPFPGKNDRRQAVAAGEVDLKHLELEELQNQLGGKVQQLYWQLVLVKRLTEIRHKHVGVVKRLLEAVQAKYASGEANQQDILKLNLLGEKLHDEIQDLSQRERELKAMINATLHRDVLAPIDTVEDVPLVPCDTSLDELIEIAKEERRLLKFWKKRAEVDRIAAEKDLYENRPDITLWTGYRIRKEAGLDQGEDFFSLGVSLPIPIDYGNRYDAKRRARLADALASEKKYMLVLNEVSSDMERHLSKWERSCEKVETYDKLLIPGAEATLEAALSAWQVGRTEFSSLYQAELQLLDFEKALLMARAESVFMSLEIERVAGAPPNTEREEAS